MNILHIDSSALGGASVSRQITAEVVRAIQARSGEAGVQYRDLSAKPLSHLSGELLAGLRPAPGTSAAPSEEIRAELAEAEEVLTEFLAADVIVVGAPMYNFSVPSQLKSWIDRIAQAGRTFRYTANGPEGLAGGRKVIVVSSRGGILAGQAHEAALDHQEAYLRTVFNFIGITDVSVVRAEGIGYGPEARDAAIAKALERAQFVGEEVSEECAGKAAVAA